MAERPTIYDLSHRELATTLHRWGQPAFRTDQIWHWLYRSLVGDWADMGNVPAALRARLADAFDLLPLTPITEQVSANGQTRKVLYRLADGQTLESVLMLYQDRRTACISTQVGCAMGCTFCATGQGGLVRHLSAGEIVAQVIALAREIRTAEIEQAQAQDQRATLEAHPVSNIVLMGMGEPLANWQATWKAIETLTDDRGYNLGARQITLSTVGLIPGIRRLIEAQIPINLAISLHAPNDSLRDQLAPVNRRYPLADLMAAVREYAESTHRRVTIEYALIDGVNDEPRLARELATLLNGLLCHVNLIPLNPTPDSRLQPSPRDRVDAFRDELEAAGIPVTVRLRRGIDIEAGCGQLRQRNG